MKVKPYKIFKTCAYTFKIIRSMIIPSIYLIYLSHFTDSIDALWRPVILIQVIMGIQIPIEINISFLEGIIQWKIKVK